MSDTPFDRQTTVQNVGPGRYRTNLSDQWNAPVLPHGGVVTALGLRAIQAELDQPDQDLRSVTTAFAGQVPPGPVEIEVTILRRGRTMSQALATVHPEGAAAGHTAIAVFGAARAGFEFTEGVPPDMTPPQDCPSFRDPLPPGVENFFAAATFWEQIECRTSKGHAPWDQWEATSAERACWLRFDEPPVLSPGVLDPMALVVLCDTMPGAVGERMGPGQPVWFGPSADLTVHVLGHAGPGWLIAHSRARHAGDGYGSLEMELWDPEGRLVAYGTQVMFFSFPDGPPPPERRTAPRRIT